MFFFNFQATKGYLKLNYEHLITFMPIDPPKSFTPISTVVNAVIGLL